MGWRTTSSRSSEQDAGGRMLPTTLCLEGNVKWHHSDSDGFAKVKGSAKGDGGVEVSVGA